MHPPWVDAIPAGRIGIVLDPGMAFGTGHHASTRGCLVLLERALRRRRRARARRRHRLRHPRHRRARSSAPARCGASTSTPTPARSRARTSRSTTSPTRCTSRARSRRGAGPVRHRRRQPAGRPAGRARRRAGGAPAAGRRRRSAPAFCATEAPAVRGAWRAAGLADDGDARRRGLGGAGRPARGVRAHLPRFLIDRAAAPGDVVVAARRGGQARARAAARRRRSRRPLRRRRPQLRRRGSSRCRAQGVRVRVIEALPERDGESPLELTLAIARAQGRPARLGDREGDRARRRPHPAVQQHAHAGAAVGRPPGALAPDRARRRQAERPLGGAARSARRSTSPPCSRCPPRRACSSPRTAAARSLARLALAAPPSLLAIVGAEGGFSPEELAAARAAGCHLVGLGPRILRAETAAVVAVALCQARWGDLASARAAVRRVVRCSVAALRVRSAERCERATRQRATRDAAPRLRAPPAPLYPAACASPSSWIRSSASCPTRTPPSCSCSSRGARGHEVYYLGVDDMWLHARRAARARRGAPR